MTVIILLAAQLLGKYSHKYFIKQQNDIGDVNGVVEETIGGYETILVRDGENLSSGQRQLIAITRTAIANPPALVLDEATSSVDTRTEAW